MNGVRTVVLALGSLLAACGSADDEGEKKPADLGAPPVYPLPGCEAIDDHPCDIREADCQERVMSLAACLRGSEPLPVPPITRMTTAEYAAYLNQQISENPPPNPDHYERALTLLGLVPPGALSQQAVVARDVEHVWGVYRDAEKDVILIDHDTPADEPAANSVLLHELVHALQDQEVDLAGYYDEFSTSYDSYLGAASIVEGEARMHETRFWSALLGLDPAAIDWLEHFQSTAEYAEEQVLLDGSPYTATYGSFPYEFGARLVNHAWQSGGHGAVLGLFAAPPRGSQPVMASVAGVASADWPEPAFAVLTPPEPFSLWTETELGAWGILIALASDSTADSVRAVARDWRGDHLAVYASAGPPEETVVVWNIELADVASATQFETLARDIPAAVVRDGARVAIAKSTGSSPLTWALAP